MALRTALPGVDAYREISGQSRLPVRARRDAREGAVLICLVDEEDGVRFPLIERAPDPGPHSGQIALPGGSAEEIDADHAATALREAEEEIGLPAREVTVVGSLTPLYIPVSNFLIHPIVGWYGGTPGLASRLVPQPEEVAAILMADVEALRRTLAVRTVNARGWSGQTGSYAVDGAVVWGATALMLAEFLAVWDASRL